MPDSQSREHGFESATVSKFGHFSLFMTPKLTQLYLNEYHRKGWKCE